MLLNVQKNNYKCSDILEPSSNHARFFCIHVCVVSAMQKIIEINITCIYLQVSQTNQQLVTPTSVSSEDVLEGDLNHLFCPFT